MLRMPYHMIPINRHIHSSRSLQLKRPIRPQQLPPSLIRSSDICRCGILHIVFVSLVTIRAEEERIFSVEVCEDRSFNVRSIGGDVGHDGNGRTDEGVSVCAGDFLEHDGGRDDGWDSVTAGSAVAEGVSVDFVDDVAAVRELLIGIACNVDGTAFGVGTDPGFCGVVHEGVCDLFGGGVGEAVDIWPGFPGCCVIEDVSSVVEADDVRGPDVRVSIDP